MERFRLSDELLGQLHEKYFSDDDIEDDGMEVFVATDLMMVEGAYRFNAVYAFKSMTSVKSYEKYLKNTGEDHKLIITTTKVSDPDQKLEVVTLFNIKDNLPEYQSSRIMDDWDDARDYTQNIKDTKPNIQVEHDSVKIRSRFSPNMLHGGWANFNIQDLTLQEF